MKRKWFKVRYIVVALIITASIAVTPRCFQEAREYRARVSVNPYTVGGECFVIPLGVMGAWGVLSLAGKIDKWKIPKYKRSVMEDGVKYCIRSSKS